MIIILKSGIGDGEVEEVCRRITEMGYAPHVIRGEFKTVVAAVGDELDALRLEHLGDHGQPGQLAGLGEVLQALLLQSLEGVGRGARLERPPA